MEIRFKPAVVEFVHAEHIAAIPSSYDDGRRGAKAFLPDKRGDVRGVPFGVDHQPALGAIRPHDESRAWPPVRDTQRALSKATR